MATAPQVDMEGGELRAFLMNLDEFQQFFHKLERRLREDRVVEVLANADLKVDTKADFSRERENLEKLAAALKKAGVDAEVEADEEHSALLVDFPRFH